MCHFDLMAFTFKPIPTHVNGMAPNTPLKVFNISTNTASYLHPIVYLINDNSLMKLLCKFMKFA